MTESWGGAGSGWGNPVVGSTALRIPAINSPNFNLANPTASPSPSWAILQSGLAYFFGLVLSGGTITGPDYIINSSGIFLYSGTPALGNLVVSLAPAAGTDQFGNVYGADLTVGTASNTQVSIRSSGGTGIIDFITNNSSFNDAQFSSFIAGAFVQTLLFGPSKVGHTDLVGIEFNSSDGSSSANGSVLYKDIAAGLHFYAGWNAAGFDIAAGNITAVHPGTGTPATPATGESWQNLVLLNGWGGSGAGVNGARVQLLPLNGGVLEIEGDIQNATALGNSNFADLPAGYPLPPVARNRPLEWNNPQANNSASQPWFFIDNTGAMSVIGIQAANKPIFFDVFIPLS